MPNDFPLGADFVSMGPSSALAKGGEAPRALAENRTGRAERREAGHGPKAGERQDPRQAPCAASSPGSNLDREPKTPGLALPTDLDGSPRLLDDA